MKTFITEQQLALYKYQPQSRYYNWTMSDIAVEQYKMTKGLDIFVFLSCLYHRLVDVNNNIWEFNFTDNSVILIKENETGIYIKSLQNIVSSDFNDYFR